MEDLFMVVFVDLVIVFSFDDVVDLMEIDEL